MKKSLCIIFLCCQMGLGAHCQMPCGIYHDEIVFGQLEEYIELMNKAMQELKTNEFATPAERANFIRWVTLKDTNSDEMAALLTKYFLQQRIKSDQTELLTHAHKVLVGMMQVKQLVDQGSVEKLKQELKTFKELYTQAKK